MDSSGPIGDVIGLIDWVENLTSGGSERLELTPEALAADTGAIIMATADSQRAAGEQIGGIGAQIGRTPKQLDEMKELVAATKAVSQAQDAAQYEVIRAQLQSMLAA